MVIQRLKMLWIKDVFEFLMKIWFSAMQKSYY